jgi:hypothetical protein
MEDEVEAGFHFIPHPSSLIPFFRDLSLFLQLEVEAQDELNQTSARIVGR